MKHLRSITVLLLFAAISLAGCAGSDNDLPNSDTTNNTEGQVFPSDTTGHGLTHTDTAGQH